MAVEGCFGKDVYAVDIVVEAQDRQGLLRDIFDALLGQHVRDVAKVDDDPAQVMDIAGLSMAARAKLVTNPAEFEKALHLLISRYPNQKGLDLPMPTISEVRIFRLTPAIVSLLDYSKGFGYADLIVC